MASRRAPEEEVRAAEAEQRDKPSAPPTYHGSGRPGGYQQALESHDPLVTFLYVLMRDHLTPGVVEGIMLGHVEQGAPMQQFSNDWLAAYAVELARRLQGWPPEHALAEAHSQLRRAQEGKPQGG